MHPVQQCPPFPSLYLQTYFYNTLTEASSWTRPEGVRVDLLPEEVEADPVPESTNKVWGD